jgi:hypothetical protein
MGLSTQNPRPEEADETGEAFKDTGAKRPARGAPGSFDQPESRPEVMPREGGPHPEQSAEVPLGHHGRSEPPGSFGHNSAPVRRSKR